jgi:hypothetical protein
MTATFTVDGPTVVVQSTTLGVRISNLADNVPEVLGKPLLAELVYQSESTALNAPTVVTHRWCRARVRLTAERSPRV